MCKILAAMQVLLVRWHFIFTRKASFQDIFLMYIFIANVNKYIITIIIIIIIITTTIIIIITIIISNNNNNK